MNIPKEWLVVALGLAAALFFPGAREWIMKILSQILNVPLPTPPGPTPPVPTIAAPRDETEEVIRAWRRLHEHAAREGNGNMEARLADMLPELVSSAQTRALKS